MSIRRNIIYSVIICFVISTVIFLVHNDLLRVGSTPRASGLVYSRIVNLSVIQKAVFNYQFDHDHWPLTLSELVPDYISTNNINIFYGPTVSVNKEWLAKLPNNRTDTKTIDECSAYLYFGTNYLNRGVLASEKPGIWKTNKHEAVEGGCILSAKGAGSFHSITQLQQEGLADIIKTNRGR